MAAQNDFLPFGNDTSANVLDQATYSALPSRTTGFPSSIARSAQLNKVWRQSASMTAAFGQICSNAGIAAIDDGNIPNLVNSLLAGLSASFGSNVGKAAQVSYDYSGGVTTLSYQAGRQYYSIVPATNNWNINVVYNGSTSLSSFANINDNLTIEIDTVIGTSLYSLGTFSIDGVAQAVKWVTMAKPASIANSSQSTIFRMLKVPAGGWLVVAELKSIGL